MCTYWSFLVDWLDNKFLIIKGDISNFTPGKPNLWSQPKRKITLFKYNIIMLKILACSKKKIKVIHFRKVFCYQPSFLFTH